MPDDKNKISDDDAALFKRSVRHVKPLQNENKASLGHRPRTHCKRPPTAATITDTLSDDYSPEEIQANDSMQFNRPGLQNKLLRKFRLGQIPIEYELDLHGKTVIEARSALVNFLHQCQTKNARCVRIIHGKGFGSSQKLPILKNKMNSWLRQRNDVLAFCSAQPADGGTGAVYVLLKRLYKKP